MEWYEILALVIALHCFIGLIGFLFWCQKEEYKIKNRKLDLLEQKIKYGQDKLDSIDSNIQTITNWFKELSSDEERKENKDVLKR